jgi:hypothetical protein
VASGLARGRRTAAVRVSLRGQDRRQAGAGQAAAHHGRGEHDPARCRPDRLVPQPRPAPGGITLVSQARRHPAPPVPAVRCPVIGTLTCQDITVSHTQKTVNAAPTASEGDRVHRMLPWSASQGVLAVGPSLRDSLKRNRRDQVPRQSQAKPRERAHPSRSPRSAPGLPHHSCGNTCALPHS